MTTSAIPATIDALTLAWLTDALGPAGGGAAIAAMRVEPVGQGFEQCLADYRRAVLFCFVYPVMAGGLGDLSNERGHALAATMAERSAAAILDWNALELLSS